MNVALFTSTFLFIPFLSPLLPSPLSSPLSHTAISDLTSEMNDQTYHVTAVRTMMTSFRTMFFEHVGTEGYVKIVGAMLQHCVLERVLLSPIDAVYCTQYAVLLNSLDVSTAHTVRTLFLHGVHDSFSTGPFILLLLQFVFLTFPMHTLFFLYFLPIPLPFFRSLPYPSSTRLKLLLSSLHSSQHILAYPPSHSPFMDSLPSSLSPSLFPSFPHFFPTHTHPYSLSLSCPLHHNHITPYYIISSLPSLSP